MPTPRLALCLAVLSIAPLLPAQNPPASYTIVQTVAFPPAGSTMTIHRSGNKVLTEISRAADGATPASRTLTLYDLAQGKNWGWNPSDPSVPCSANNFTGDWGDPFAMTSDLNKGIKDGSFKPAGAETLDGIPTKIYAGATGGTGIKAWLDEKDGLVLRAMIGAPGGTLQPLVNITKVSFAPPAASLFALPSNCAGVKPPPTPADLIASETGDSSANWVNAIYGPGSKNSCSILIHIVAAKTMAPFTRRWQAAIDTTYNQDSPTPPHYEFGVGRDGTATFEGGGLHEITSQIHNNTLRIDNPPAYFNMSTNFIQPGRGAGIGLVYRQCFAPVTNLYYVLKDPNDPGDGDWLYAKSGKYAAVPAH
jgi:hypothetical protein